MFKLQEKIKVLQDQCDSLGESMFGLSYEDCCIAYDEDLGTDMIIICEDCGHEFESDDRVFDSQGNEL